MTLRPSWWRNAVEAAPSTAWWLEGKRQLQGTILVRGTLLDVVAGFGIDGDEGPQRIVGFNSRSASTDVVVVRVKVSDGSSEIGDVPDEMSIGLPLPAPTDLESLAVELSTIKEFAAILFPAVGLTGIAGLYEVLGSRYFGEVDAEGRVKFGSLMGDSEGRGRVESVDFARMKRGAGVVRLADLDGTRVAG